MAEARCKNAWDHTAAVLAMLANVNRDPKKSKVFKPADFHPYAKRKDRGIVVTKENMSLMKQAFKSGNFKKRKGER